MEVKEFEVWMDEVRDQFKDMLEFPDTEFGEIKGWVLRRFEKCTNEFEEQTLAENLAEEFQGWMKGLVA